MAEDRLIFGIGFDLDSAVKDAEKDFGRVIKDLQTVANEKPLHLSVETDLKSIKAAEGSISALREEMARLSKAWNSITNTAKFNDDGTLTKEAKELADQYMAATNSMAKYGMTLEQITRGRKQAIVDKQKAEEKRYQEWLRNKQQEATENERIERQKQAATARTIAEQNKEYARQAAAEEKRQAAISSSLRSEYKRIELKQQEEAASQRELQMLNERLRKEAQIAAATKNQSMQAAYNARRKAGLDLQRTLQAEENSIAAINAKLKIQRQRLNEVDMGSAKFNKIAQEVERLSKKLEEANNRVARLTGQTVAGQKRITNAVNETNKAYSSTEGYISRLIKRTLVLFGIRQVMRFAERIREVTAEFELQRVSLGAIIQDTEKANALFNQIKTFAVQSPFEIKDLVGYVKQLSAYRIETDKLFDTTKRLADVAAGIGVDMSRLILAYGQVRAASVLRGQEVRQFTEAGIPLIELLAEKFTALRGEMVSTSEVFDLISQRAVSFEMVAEIFEDMTNAGGMFYNMQEKQAQTLAGQWSNLKDSLSIMYDEMGNTKGVQAGLRGIISLTKTLAENWQLVAAYMGDIVGGFAIVKGIGAYKSLVKVVKKDVLGVYNQLRAAQRAYNAAWKEEQIIMRAGIAADMAAAKAKTDAAEASLKVARATAQAARGTNVLTFAWKKLTAVMKANWVYLLISALVVAYQTISHLVSKSNELKKALQDIGREGAKNIATTTWNFERLAKRAVDAADGSVEQREALEELQRTYKNMIPTHQLTIENLRQLEGNYKSLTDAVREYSEEQIYVQKVEAILADTQNKVENIADKLKEKLKGTSEIINGFTPVSLKFSNQQIDTALNYIKRRAKETSDDVRTVIQKGFEDAGITLTEEKLEALYQLGGYNNNFKQFIYTIRAGEYEIEKLRNSVERAGNTFSIYGQYIDVAKKNIDEWKQANKELQSTSPFDYNKALLKKSGEEYRKAIKWIINHVNSSLSADKKIKLNEDWFSGEYIDTKAILKTLQDAGLDISSQAYQSVKKIQDAYMNFVPSTNFVKVINGKFEEVGKSMGDNVLNIINQDLMKSDENIDDFVKRFFDTLDDLKLKIKQKEAELKSTKLNKTEREDEEKSLKNLKIRLAVHEKMASEMEKYRISKSDGTGDDEIQRLKLMVQLLEKVYNNYKKYTEYESKSKAQERINREFGETLEIFKQYGIELPKTSEEYQKALKKLQDVMRTLPKSQKDVLELGFKIEKVDFEDSKKNLEKELKRLADEVSRTKVAKEFFDKMLNLTGDRELSATVTMSVYGDTGKGLHDAVVNQIKNAFQGIPETELNIAFGVDTIDYKKLRDIWEADKAMPENLRKIPKEYDKTIKQILDSGDDANKKILESFGKLLMSYDEIAQKRINIENEAAKKIEDIDAGLALFLQENARQVAKAQTEADKQKLQQAAEAAKARAEAAKAGVVSEKDLGLLKLSDDYLRFFDAIHTLTKKEATNLRSNLRTALFKAFQDGAISASELRRELKALEEQFDKLINDTGYFGTYLRNGIDGVIQRTRQLADELDAVAAEMSKMENPDQITEGQKSFIDKILKKFGTDKTGKSFADLFSNANGDTKQMAQNLQDAAGQMQGMSQHAGTVLMIVDEIIKGVNSTITGIADVRDQLNSMRSDTRQLEGGFFDAFEYIEEFNKYAFQGWEKLKSGDFIGAGISVIQSIISIFSTAQRQKVERLNKEIEHQGEIINALEYSYNRLQKSVDKLFGTEYIANFRKQIENIRAQIAATEKQLAAEQAKGKSTDDNKVKEYQEQIRDLKDSITELTSELSTQMLGTDIASAARSFAQSWLDAYKEFGDTAGAIEERMEELMENLMTEAILGAITQKALEPLFNYIENLNAQDFSFESTWEKILELQQNAQKNMNVGLSVGASYLDQMGMLTRKMGSQMSGISKDIASASEESILGLSSNIMTQNYYISHIDTTVSQILAMMSGGGTEFSSNEQITDLITIQNQHLAYLPSIALNTAQTAERCERAAAACENIAENLNRVIKPNGVQGNYRVNTSL